MCPRERLVIISKQTGLSFVLKGIGPLAATIITAFYLLVLYLSATSKPPEYLSVRIYSESFIETACQHLLLLVGIDILTYRKYYDTSPILVGHHAPPPPLVRIGQGGGRPLSFPLSPPSLSPTPTLGRVGVLLPVEQDSPWGGPRRAGLSPSSTPLYTEEGGTP